MYDGMSFEVYSKKGCLKASIMLLYNVLLRQSFGMKGMLVLNRNLLQDISGSLNDKMPMFYCTYRHLIANEQ